MLHPSRVEGRSPSLLVVPRELQVVALASHPDGDVPDPGPRVEPRAESVERAIVRGQKESGESEYRPQALAAWVEHALLDHGAAHTRW
jgi:hypothetical protein